MLALDAASLTYPVAHVVHVVAEAYVVQLAGVAAAQVPALVLRK